MHRIFYMQSSKEEGGGKKENITRGIIHRSRGSTEGQKQRVGAEPAWPGRLSGVPLPWHHKPTPVMSRPSVE